MIQFTDVKKSFRSVRVLNGISLHVEPGERLALVGLNGAGKTTLIRTLLGEYNYKGQVLVAGLCPRKNRRHVLEKISFVPQMPPPLKMPVGELIRFSSSVCGSNPKDIEDIAASMSLDISEIRKRPFVKLSGGQKQKVLVAIALGREVEVLVMDEPAANLDPEARGVLFGLLAERKDSTMIISSHRLDEVSSLVTRVVELDTGLVVLDEKVAEGEDLGKLFRCELIAAREESALYQALQSWGFQSVNGGKRWEGTLQGADKFRFLGMLSRYSGIVSGINLQENE